MGLLRTNNLNEATALGGGIAKWLNGSLGSPLGNAGVRFYGGTVMFSITSTESVPLSIGTDSVLAQFYGVTMVSNFMDGGAGYKVVAIAINRVSELSQPFVYSPIYTQIAANSTVFITARKLQMSANGGDLVVSTLASTRDHHIVVTGLIVSAPTSPW